MYACFGGVICLLYSTRYPLHAFCKRLCYTCSRVYLSYSSFDLTFHHLEVGL